MDRPAGVAILALFEFFIATLLTFLAITSALGIGALGAIIARASRLGDPASAMVVPTGMIGVCLSVLCPRLRPVEAPELGPDRKPGALFSGAGGLVCGTDVGDRSLQDFRCAH